MFHEKGERTMTNTHRILIIVTNTSEFQKVGFRTGLWLSELTHFWDVAEEAGYQMDIASPTGGSVPIDPESLIMTKLGQLMGMDGAIFQRYKDRSYMNRLGKTLSVAEVNVAAYDAIYMTGGHGVMFDFPESLALAEVVTKFYTTGKIVSAVCHGPCGLLEAKLHNGDYLVRGKNLTGFSWKEEILAKRDNAVPFKLEDELKKRGAYYSAAPVPFTKHLVRDGLLITGQNPVSAQAVGLAVVRKLSELQSEAALTP